jgi:pimeloyl-ACP methyl ester carboxylesterase
MTRAGPASSPGDGRHERPEQTRARYPDATGFVERDGVRVFWERYGDGAPTILLMPTWSIFHARHWKAQIAYLARHFRVVTFDGRGNGRSDRPPDQRAYADTEFAADAAAVLDATGTNAAFVAGLSMGAGYAMRLAGMQPKRVLGLILFGPSISMRADPAAAADGADRNDTVEDPQPTDEGWAKYNVHYWRRDWPGFAEWFASDCIFTEPHSTKQIEDAVGWTLGTDPETIIATERAPYLEPPPGWTADDPSHGPGWAIAEAVRCPALVVNGTDDRLTSIATARVLAQALRAPMVEVEGGGHAVIGRDPVLANLLIRAFVEGRAVGR